MIKWGRSEIQRYVRFQTAAGRWRRRIRLSAVRYLGLMRWSERHVKLGHRSFDVFASAVFNPVGFVSILALCPALERRYR